MILGEIAQLIKCLLCKHENSSSIPGADIKKLYWYSSPVITAVGGRDGNLGDSLAGQSVYPSPSKRPCLKFGVSNIVLNV